MQKGDGPLARNPVSPRLGIALSGGTLKASAHIGVLAALEQIGVHATHVAGTSAGSLVAALYAHGYSTGELQTLVREFPGPKLFDYGFPFVSSLFNLIRYRFCQPQLVPPSLPAGLLQGRKLTRYLENLFENRESYKPFYIVATDLMTGKPVVLSNDQDAVRRGVAVPCENLAQAVLGSCSLPGVFRPVQLGRYLLADGAFRHYVPVQVLRMMGCERILAVNLYRLKEDWKPETFVHVLLRSLDILLQEAVDADIAGEDVFVLEPNVSEVNWTSFQKLIPCMKAGEQVVERNQSRILSFIESGPRDARGPLRHRQAPVIRIHAK